MRLILFFLIVSTSVYAQLKGAITDIDNNPIPYVNIYIENSYNGTTSNENGDYVLALSKKGSYKVVFQFLGYKTKTSSIDIKEFPYELDITLQEENISLNEVVVPL